ncbi:VOC family protein [Ilyomonas limi]|uniref:VOC family protein n=1 Tax=Ilyomonas limi TaxID=2575867 RepID=A0A4U3LB00_9BACT|nr:VOC family protein [Ilyomonas limi]TKK71909.1 VOC family protein [Ilyomonas limi]
MNKICSFFCLLLCIAFTTVSLAQSQTTPRFNHTTIYVVDLQKSADFYRKVMQLQEIPEPFHDNRHVWFKIGEHAELHVVQGAKAVTPHDINIHLAFSVPSVEAFAKHLDVMNVKYGNWAQNTKEPQLRPDGIKQIYFQDPEGYWIEVNDDKF